MSIPNPDPVHSPYSPSLRAAWGEIETQLAARLAEVKDEIRHYPGPIPACDAQFNHLLEQRSGILQALRRARSLAQSAAPPDGQRALQAFVESCPYLDRADIRALRA